MRDSTIISSGSSYQFQMLSLEAYKPGQAASTNSMKHHSAAQ